jgi:AAA+ ATPase superfamily predicted ATPase
MLKPADIFDRDREWGLLERFVEDPKQSAALGVVSGRRRQGKSFLLEAVCEQAGGFYFSAQEATEAESLSLLGDALTRELDPVVPFRPRNWAEVIDVLLRMGRERPVPVVLDEFPYLVRAAPSLPSVIQGAYAPRRAERTSSRTRLLLCGSAMSFMGGLLAGNAPLRGRASLDMIVQTLDYRLAAQFWGIQDPRLAFLAHAIVGGTPAYRTEMIRYDAPRDAADFDDWVVRAILSPGSPMFLEARYLLAEEPDLRDGALYHSVLAAIAEGNTERGAIGTRIGRKTNDLAHPLNVLEDAGLVRREVDAFRANRTHFRVNEPLLAFYHAIIRPFWPQLSRATDTMGVWRRANQRFAGNILGPRFEELCREWVLRFAGDRFGGIPASVASGTLNDPASKSTCQVDVVVLGHTESGSPPVLAIGEAKWNEVMDASHMRRLKHIQSIVAGAGKYDTTRTRLVCFSGAGFSAELAEAAWRGEVDLVGIEELYAVLRGGSVTTGSSRSCPPSL